MKLLIMLFLNQISRREYEHSEKYPDAKIIKLGIGDTSEPIPDCIASAMAKVNFLLFIFFV